MSKPKKITLADGSVRYQIVTEAGRDPETGKRKQVMRRFERLKDANAELARVTHERNRGTYVPPSKLTMDALLDGYLKSACFEREEATRSNYAHALRLPRERLGGRLAQGITRADIEELRDYAMSAGRKRGGTPGTRLGPRAVRLMLSRLSAALEQAVDDGKLAANPCRRVKAPKLAAGAKEAWSEEEARKFLGEAGKDRLHPLWRMSLYGGRREEISGARWEEDIDLDARTWTVNVVRVVVDGKVIVKEAPKSEKSARPLPLDDDLTAALTALHRRQLEEKLAAGPAYQDSGYVAADELGGAINPEWLSDEFGRLVKRAGVRRITLHGARHTACSLMEKAGVPISIVSLWAGHASPEFTYRVYAHAGDDDLSAARDALSPIYKIAEG